MSVRISPWLRASLQGTTLLGAAMIVLIWASTTAYLNASRDADINSAMQESSNLARAFEEHITRIVRGTDNTLIILRSMYQTDRKNFEFIDWSGGITNDSVLHYSVIDTNGNLVNSSRRPVPTFSVADKPHFQKIRSATTDELHIGRPIDGSLSGKTTIQLSRRLRNSDGSFAGEIAASLDTEQLVKFYEAIDIGQAGSISLVGLDGYIRAQRGFKVDNIINLKPNRGVFTHLEKAPSGNYMNDGQFDGVERLVSYRKVADLPLIVIVGLAKEEILAKYHDNQANYYALAGGMTLIVLIVMALSIGHQRKLEQAHNSLIENQKTLCASRQKLKTTLDNIDQGILMADARGNIGVLNHRLIELLDLPQEWLAKRPTMQEMLTLLIERGEYGDDGKLLDKAVWDIIRNGGLSNDMRTYERTRPNGRILEIRARPVLDGGTVRTFTDITERKRAELKAAKLATHDDLTGLANRKLFRERVNEALSRAKRHSQNFSVLLFDLDRFKDINDTLGHPVGDAVLKEIAYRLLVCVREYDTVGRLGGDEFAILQTRMRSDEDAAQLAERVIKIIRAPFFLEGQEIDLATSIGIAVGPRDGDNYDLLIKHADAALYRAKDAGGNLFCFHGMEQTTATTTLDLLRAVS